MFMFICCIANGKTPLTGEVELLNALECNEYSALCQFFTSIAAPDPPNDTLSTHASWIWPWYFLAGRFRSGENPGGVWRTREDCCNISVPLCRSPTPIPSQAQYFQGCRNKNEVLCNGRVSDLLAELSGREVIELLGTRCICSTFSFLDAHCVEKLGLS